LKAGSGTNEAGHPACQALKSLLAFFFEVLIGQIADGKHKIAIAVIGSIGALVALPCKIGRKTFCFYGDP
jgi:hypothetical protein